MVKISESMASLYCNMGMSMVDSFSYSRTLDINVYLNARESLSTPNVVELPSYGVLLVALNVVFYVVVHTF